MKGGKKKDDSPWKRISENLYRYKPSGVYYAWITRRGKLIHHSLSTGDLPLARRLLAEYRKDLNTIDPETARRTLDVHAPLFLKTITGKQATQFNAKEAVRKILRDWPKESPRAIAKIKPRDCQTWLASYEKAAASTVNSLISTTRKFFDLAVSDGVIARSPAEGIKYKRRPELIRLTPTPEQFADIVADLRSQSENGHGAEDTADFVALSGLLGLGQAELSAIQRQHIDLKKGTIKVFRRKTSQAFTIPIYPQAREIIEKRLAQMPSKASAPLLPFKNCRGALEGACKRLKLPHFEMRALRRFFITQALRRGVDVATVASWQGHRDGGSLILKTYADEVRLDHSLAMAQLMQDKPVAENVVEADFKQEAG